MKAIALDIDGCVTNGKGNHTSPSLLSSLNQALKKSNTSSFLCTGRSAPYVEAVAQFLDINQWCICENGAYLYHPIEDSLIYHPLINKNTLNALADFQIQLQKNKYKKICRKELGKEVCISLNPLDMSIKDLFYQLKEVVNRDLLYINYSTTAVDITPIGVDKGSALEFLCRQQTISPDDVLAIGDSSGDIPFMSLSGYKACPSNSSDSVKLISDYISDLPATSGVIDIIKYFSKT